jgi:hypothetical protein
MTSSGAPKAASSPSCLEFSAEGTLHVFYRSVDGQIVELWWFGSETAKFGSLTGGNDAPLPGPYTSPTSHLVQAGGLGFDTLHVFYKTEEAPPHMEELSWSGSETAHPRDLATLTEAVSPNIRNEPISHVYGNSQHVFFANDLAHIDEVFWQGSADPTLRFITQESVAPQTSGKPTSHIADGIQHLFYRACGHIIELSWRGTERPSVRDLNLLTAPTGGAPDAAGDPISHVDPDGTQHVFYVSVFSGIVELSWLGIGGVPQVRLLTLPPGDGSLSAAPWIGLTTYVFDADGRRHLFYGAEGNEQGHIVELTWTGNEAPAHVDLFDNFAAPIAEAGQLVSLVYSAENPPTQHVFYTVSPGDIIELWSKQP